eukprot:587833-Pleurochrysis_carterae.AAC.1
MTELLTEIERWDGIVILATNRRAAHLFAAGRMHQRRVTPSEEARTRDRANADARGGRRWTSTRQCFTLKWASMTIQFVLSVCQL